MKRSRIPSSRAYGFALLAMLLVGLLTVAGCESETLTEPESLGIEQVAISPSTASIPVGEQYEFSAVLVTADADTIDPSDLDVVWEWWSTDPSVFEVEAGGLATGLNPGEAFCVVEVTVLEVAAKNQRRNFTGRDSAFVMIF
jgi:hypothetical protein